MTTQTFYGPPVPVSGQMTTHRMIEEPPARPVQLYEVTDHTTGGTFQLAGETPEQALAEHLLSDRQALHRQIEAKMKAEEIDYTTAFERINDVIRAAQPRRPEPEDNRTPPADADERQRLHERIEARAAARGLTYAEAYNEITGGAR